MPPPLHNQTQPTFRNAIQSIAFCALLLRASDTFPIRAQVTAAGGAVSAPLLASAALWRAMFLMGYGPTPWLVQALAQAGSPRDWALQ